jgi:hypothetical protein
MVKEKDMIEIKNIKFKRENQFWFSLFLLLKKIQNILEEII